MCSPFHKEYTMPENLPVVDLMRIRFMKGEPLLQAGDSFAVFELMSAMATVEAEAKARGLSVPIAIRQG
jgi:hypothetical protein